MSIVIDNPKAEAQLHAFATSRGLTPDEAIIEAIEAAKREDEDGGFRITPEDIEAMKRSAADSDAGRVSDGRANMARRRAALGMPPYSAS